MSVLNFPRLYLNGHMFWNPPTGNNNDMFPLYDACLLYTSPSPRD